MEPLTERSIRDCFINCSKGEARRMSIPRDLETRPWADLDFFGWRDPGAPDRGFLVAEHDGGLVGVTLRAAPAVRRSFTKTTVCSVCVTSHPGTGVALLAAPRAGTAGRRGNTVGAYLCADLECSLYIRGRKRTGGELRTQETLSLAQKVERLHTNLAEFLAKVRID